MCEIVQVIGGDESSEANRGQILVLTQKQSLESYSNRQERTEAIVRELKQSSESRSNRERV